MYPTFTFGWISQSPPFTPMSCLVLIHMFTVQNCIQTFALHARIKIEVISLSFECYVRTELRVKRAANGTKKKAPKVPSFTSWVLVYVCVSVHCGTFRCTHQFGAFSHFVLFPHRMCTPFFAIFSNIHLHAGCMVINSFSSPFLLYIFISMGGYEPWAMSIKKKVIWIVNMYAANEIEKTLKSSSSKTIVMCVALHCTLSLDKYLYLTQHTHRHTHPLSNMFGP